MNQTPDPEVLRQSVAGAMVTLNEISSELGEAFRGTIASFKKATVAASDLASSVQKSFYGNTPVAAMAPIIQIFTCRDLDRMSLPRNHIASKPMVSWRVNRLDSPDSAYHVIPVKDAHKYRFQCRCGAVLPTWKMIDVTQFDCDYCGTSVVLSDVGMWYTVSERWYAFYCTNNDCGAIHYLPDDFKPGKCSCGWYYSHHYRDYSLIVFSPKPHFRRAPMPRRRRKVVSDDDG